ncbi:DUF2871 family protein [Ramlibacter pallidus]|uniref:DUF2871 family protein n=1 Tax=Ramlibacter pallidus TaxID=2780087 RepID=A0ABR9RZY8_9BURK|nr:DUF2871 family protein [Ramlibacter pallidus]MBE7366779.1 DUF2871 family protein [Ramlibacter pallidus]
MHLNLLRLSFVYLLAGMLLGVGMGASGDFTLRPVHAHVNLLGWAVLAVAALILRVYPYLQRDWRFRGFVWIYNVAMPASLLALAGMLVALRSAGGASALAGALKVVAITSSLGLLVSVALLLAALWRQPQGVAQA